VTEKENIKVLVADDEDSLRVLLKAVINSEQGFEFQEAVDGDDTLAKVEKDKPDILILDVMMPGKTGFEVCELLKQDPNNKDIQIIILTAKGQESDQEWAKSCGADYFLRKPFSPLELIDILKSLKQKLIKN
jgi:CheY-like chemotaxis protein